MYNLKKYIESVKKFVEDTKEWGNLDRYQHYVAVNGEWVESCDNAEGGLDVSWSFKKDVDLVLIKEHFIEEITNMLRCLALDNDVTDLDISIINKE